MGSVPSFKRLSHIRQEREHSTRPENGRSAVMNVLLAWLVNLLAAAGLLLGCKALWNYFNSPLKAFPGTWSSQFSCDTQIW